MPETTLKGSCLCGAVKYAATGEPARFHHCHCSRCRKATGTGHASNLYLQPGLLKWLSGEEQVRSFKVPEANRFTRAHEPGSSPARIRADSRSRMRVSVVIFCPALSLVPAFRGAFVHIVRRSLPSRPRHPAHASAQVAAA